MVTRIVVAGSCAVVGGLCVNWLINVLHEWATKGDEMEDKKLSEAMDAGIKMRPKRATGVYFAGEDRSDILGAAYQGLTGDTDVHNYQVDAKLESAFPILRRKVSNPETGDVATLKTVVRQLNDRHQWKRKNIARFVKAVESRLALQKASVVA